jgi:hypothetical protein
MVRGEGVAGLGGAVVGMSGGFGGDSIVGGGGFRGGGGVNNWGSVGLGGGCPLAVGFTTRRDNSIFSLMCRKQSTDVINPYPPGPLPPRVFHTHARPSPSSLPLY